MIGMVIEPRGTVLCSVLLDGLRNRYQLMGEHPITRSGEALIAVLCTRITGVSWPASDDYIKELISPSW